MYKICVYAPEKHVEKVKLALFEAGAGQIGNYDSCCWQTHGTGQFRPLDGSKPNIGNLHSLEHVAEVKIEMLCTDSLIQSAVDALRIAHPYEEPAFDVWKLAEF